MNKRILLLLGVAAMAFPGLLSAAPENVALHCPYVCSDPNTHGWDKPGLTDGVNAYGNQNCFATNDGAAFPKTVTVDLGKPRSIQTVAVSVPPYGSTKTVEVSLSADNATFTPFGQKVFEQKKAERALIEGAKTTARYLRLTYADFYPEKVNYPSTFAFTSELEAYECKAAEVPASLPVALPATLPENFALHCPYVSSDPNTKNWDQPGLTDGIDGKDNKTCYASGDSPTFPKYVTIDLGKPRDVQTVIVCMPAFGSTKTVEVSLSADNAAFTPFGKKVFEEAKQQRAPITGAKTTARYVRLTYPDFYPATHGYGVNFAFTSEVEVYGCTPAELAATAAITPAIKDEYRHQTFLNRIKAGPVGLLFLGDSITDFWPRTGELTWLKFAPYQPADFGIGGDRTQHVLWRIKNGELDGINPKATVLMIGTNNVRSDAPEATAEGVKQIVETVRQKLPQTKILLLGIFPRDMKASDLRQKNEAVNAIISKLGDNKTVFYQDIGSVFLDAQGEIPRDIMPDLLHPSAKGYELWYNAMMPKLTELMK